MSLIEARAKDWKLVPHHLHLSLRLWVDEGVQPEGFLLYVISNDLKNTALYQDSPSTDGIVGLVRFLQNNCPAPCWGNLDNVKTWPDRLAEMHEGAA